MKKTFHNNVVRVAFQSMPEEFQEKFLKNFSLELLLEYSDVSYVSDRFEPSEFAHINHTYKLYLKGRDLHKTGDGDVLSEIVKLANGVKLMYKEGNDQLIRYNISKGTHFIIDLGTYPHCVEALWDKYHEKFEEMASDWLEANLFLIEKLVENYKPEAFRSVPNRTRALAEEAYFDSLDILPILKRNAYPTQLQWASMCTKHVYNVMNWFAAFEPYL